MSAIEKMTIQGIRSFGPDVQDRQQIDFDKPLTLILGPNGSGKTTIIECLKYMTTGVMPPGSTKGAAFIHDLKVADAPEVMGMVRLQFNDISRKTVTVQRTIKATQKEKKVEMRTLECLTTRLNAAGEIQDISSRCADFDKEMITSLGVSKPILEHVIFCHQEEVNWPLSEGKQLKEKFDAIFASTRYVKALESIKKTKKELSEKLQHFRAEVECLKQNKDNALQLKADLKKKEAELKESESFVFEVNSKLKPIMEELHKLDDQIEAFSGTQNDITKLESEKKQIEKHAQELQNQLEKEFKGSDKKLKKMMEEFKDKLQKSQKSLEKFKKKKEDLSQQADEQDREKSAILVDLGRLEQEAERQQADMARRDELIKQYANEYKIKGLKGAITDKKYKLFLTGMRSKLESMEEAARLEKLEFEEKESKIQAEIDELRDSKTKLKHNETIKRNMETDLQTRKASVNVDEIRQKISDLNTEKSVLEASISELNSEINRLTLQSSAQAELDMLEKDRASKEENIRRLEAKHEDTIKYLLGHAPGKNVGRKLEEYMSKQNEKVRRCSAQVNDTKISLSMVETEHEVLMKQVTKKDKELKGLDEGIYSVCGSQNLDEGLSAIQEKMEKARDQRGLLVGEEHLFKTYAAELEKEHPCCPLCHRGFETQQDIRELVHELEDNLFGVQNKLTTAEREVDEYKKKYDTLMQLKPLQEQMEELSQLKAYLKTCEDKACILKDKLKEIEKDLKEQEDDDAMAKQMQTDIVIMDLYYGDVAELDKKIGVQGAKLPGGDSGRTLQTVVNETKDLQVRVETITRELEHKRQNLGNHLNQVQMLQAAIKSLSEEKIESSLQQRIKLEEDKANLISENQDISDTEDNLGPIHKKMEDLRSEKEVVIKRKEERLAAAKAAMDKVKSRKNQVETVNKDIKSYNQSGKADRLKERRTTKDDISKNLEKIEQERGGVADSIDKLQKDLSTQRVRELDLQNNWNLRSKRKETKEILRKITDLEAVLQRVDVTKLDIEHKKLNKEYHCQTREQYKAEGQQLELKNQIQKIETDLQKDIYKDAEKKYRNKIIDLKTTHLAIGDLEKYYNALDKAIINYHTMKMAEINKIIGELWRQTYRGHDIETVEIRSDEDDSDTMKTRKTYNYRVVMIKPKDIAIDMRARCSAGQKVLASLIIRLALAETFCLNCGILALDEPTTNLDRENIESLAAALVEIVKGRIAQKNFQLVIITHDEDFLELMGRSDYVDHFFRVSKTQDGFSRITKTKVSELHQE